MEARKTGSSVWKRQGTRTGASKSKASSDPNKYAAALRVASKAVKDLAAYYKNDKHILKDAVAKRGGKSEAVTADFVTKLSYANVNEECVNPDS